MESSSKFEYIFYRLIAEDVTAASALGSSPGGFNPHEGNIISKDSYNPEDMRTATPPNVIQTRKGAIKRRRKLNKKRKK